jgi:hypothetical protein
MVAVFKSISLPRKCTKYDISTGRRTEDSQVTVHNNDFPALSLEQLALALKMTTLSYTRTNHWPKFWANSVNPLAEVLRLFIDNFGTARSVHFLAVHNSIFNFWEDFFPVFLAKSTISAETFVHIGQEVIR